MKLENFTSSGSFLARLTSRWGWFTQRWTRRPLSQLSPRWIHNDVCGKPWYFLKDQLRVLRSEKQVVTKWLRRALRRRRKIRDLRRTSLYWGDSVPGANRTRNPQLRRMKNKKKMAIPFQFHHLHNHFLSFFWSHGYKMVTKITGLYWVLNFEVANWWHRILFGGKEETSSS